jgi:cyanophycinase-like exopeptidase
MNGSLALVGSGEYLPGMAEFERSLLDDGIKNGKKPTYVQIPTAAGRESQDRLNYWKELGKAQADRLGIEQIYLPIFNRDEANNGDIAKLINESALMYMSGGDPHHLAKSLLGTVVWDSVQENWLSGASLAGCSAGAMVLSSHIPNFRLTKSAPTEGLNIIPNIRVIPHFNKFFKWIPDSAAKVMLNVPDDCVLIGVDEMTAIVKRTGSTDWRVHGDAKLHVLKGAPERELSDGETITL